MFYLFNHNRWTWCKLMLLLSIIYTLTWFEPGLVSRARSIHSINDEITWFHYWFMSLNLQLGFNTSTPPPPRHSQTHTHTHWLYIERENEHHQQQLKTSGRPIQNHIVKICKQTLNCTLDVRFALQTHRTHRIGREREMNTSSCFKIA